MISCTPMSGTEVVVEHRIGWLRRIVDKVDKVEHPPDQCWRVSGVPMAELESLIPDDVADLAAVESILEALCVRHDGDWRTHEDTM